MWMAPIKAGGDSHRDRRGDVRMGIVADYLEILVAISVDRIRPAMNGQLRQRPRLAAELQPRLFEVVRVEMAIAAGPDERARLQPALLGQHVGEKRVAGDVERDAEEDVGA